MTRYISHSQATQALDCPVAYDLRYVGHLTGGTTLKPRTTHPRLRAGRAWGATIQHWHQHGGRAASVQAGLTSLNEDAAEIEAKGVSVNFDEHRDLGTLIADAFDDYVVENPYPLGLVDSEVHIVVPIMRGYRYEAYFDGVFHANGEPWLYEAKFRATLSSRDQVERSRQVWWYAWAYREKHGKAPQGIIVEERLAAAPKPVNFNKDGSVSKVQSCRAEAYWAACKTLGQDADLDVHAKLNAKKWSVRHEIVVRDRDLDAAGRQIRAAAEQISLYDRGKLYPIHNPSPSRCPSCAFKDVCVAPDDAGVVDALFVRGDPARSKKREKETRR